MMDHRYLFLDDFFNTESNEYDFNKLHQVAERIIENRSLEKGIGYLEEIENELYNRITSEEKNYFQMRAKIDSVGNEIGDQSREFENSEKGASIFNFTRAYLNLILRLQRYIKVLKEKQCALNQIQIDNGEKIFPGSNHSIKDDTPVKNLINNIIDFQKLKDYISIIIRVHQNIREYIESAKLYLIKYYTNLTLEHLLKIENKELDHFYDECFSYPKVNLINPGTELNDNELCEYKDRCSAFLKVVEEKHEKLNLFEMIIDELKLRESKGTEETMCSRPHYFPLSSHIKFRAKVAKTRKNPALKYPFLNNKKGSVT